VTSSVLTGDEIKAVVFDFGMTLVSVKQPNAELDQAFETIAELLTERNYDPVPGAARLRSAIGDTVDAIFSAHEEEGELKESDHLATVDAAYRAIGLDLAPQDLVDVVTIEQEAWWSGITMGPSTVSVLKLLRTSGLKVGVCSNAPYYSPAMHQQFQHLGLVELCDSVVLSVDVGFRKPSPVIFTTILEQLEAPAKSTIFVGDRQREDIAGAAKSGMRTVRIREHFDDDSGIWEADAVIEEISQLPALLGIGESM
jgi:HAD superfamily hydrolase (TIGR01549 family)